MRLKNHFDVFLHIMTKLSRLSINEYDLILQSVENIKINYASDFDDEPLSINGYIIMPNRMMINIDFSIYQTLIKIVSALLDVDVIIMKRLLSSIGCNPVEWMIFLSNSVVIVPNIYLCSDYMNESQKEIFRKLHDIYQLGNSPLNHPEEFIFCLVNSKVVYNSQ